MIRVLDLFAGTQSVKKALTEMYEIKEWKFDNGIWKGSKYFIDEIGDIIPDVEYIGIDIHSPQDKNVILDLTQDYIIPLLELKLNGWKPDFLWCSPVCNNLSLTTALIGGHNPYFKVDKELQEITSWKLGDHCEGRKTLSKLVGLQNSIDRAENTLKMFDNMKRIIKYFKIPFVVENPQHSLTKYLMKDYINNVCSYCMYGFEQRKNTIIFSDRKIELKKCNHKGLYHKLIHSNALNQQRGRKPITDYNKKAAVPTKLIIAILKELLDE